MEITQTRDNKWSKVKDFIREKTRNYKNLVAIGTGGNINKIFSMSKKKDGKPLPLDLLKEYHTNFSNYGLRERMKAFNLREDRADVIVPALRIFINVMRWSNTDEILVPKIGLADGLIQHLYQELCLREMEV